MTSSIDRTPDLEPAPAAAPPAAAAKEKILLRPRPGWVALDVRELLRYRELLWFLALRDIKVRYKQTALGAAWAVIQPFMTMVVFSVFLGKLAGLQKDTGGIPYPVWSFCGLLPWTLFAYALQQSSNSLVANERLITKVYFPRLIMPISAILSGLVDFAIAFAVLIGMMIVYGIYPGRDVVWLPVFVLMVVVVALAVGMWLSALNVQYRDVRYTIPFLTQLWMFLTPVVYPSKLVPDFWKPLYGLNPMAGVVEGFRWCLIREQEVHWPLLGVSMAVTLVLLVGGMFFFRRMEKTFADVV